MVRICPISLKNINENVSRLNAFFTFAFVLGFLFTGNFWFLPVIIIDFCLRLAMEGKISPVVQLNKFFSNLFNFPKVMINAGPKIFAARIGLTLAVITIVFFFFSYQLALLITISVLGFFSFLEFAFGFCVACKIYPYALFLNDIKLFR